MDARSVARSAPTWVLLAALLGCGGKAASEGRSADPSPAASRPVPAAPMGASGSSPARPLPGGPPVEAVSPPLPPVEPPSGMMGEKFEPLEDFARAEDILMTYCGSCHGPLAPIESSGGVRFIDDFDRLVAIGWLVPLSSATSPIVRVSLQGSMPPVGSGLPLMDDISLQRLVAFIDNPRYWAGSPPEGVTDAGVAMPDVDAGRDAGR